MDPQLLDTKTLAELPAMTKDDLMEHFDDIVTDDRLRLDVVEAHLESLTSDAYLFDRYHAVASGGSTGRRGVFVYDWDGWARAYCSVLRFEIRARQRHPELAAAPNVNAKVFSRVASHLSGSLFETFANPDNVWHAFAVNQPVDEIVAGLNAAQPTVLFGYPSSLHPLVHEAEAGRLRIAPRRVLTSGEALLPEIRTALEATWGVPVANMWSASEAPAAAPSCGESPGIHLSDDLVIIEPVDAAGRPVPLGVRSDKVLLTNLYNHTLPLIRYEITDEMTFLDESCPCGSAFQRIADPHGRLDDTFDYGNGVSVHPLVFRSPLSRRRQIVEYQVCQTPAGAFVRVRATAPFDEETLVADIEAGLARLGLPAPEVTLGLVDRLERQHSGKLKRFVPLGA
jgi:phenylacetate-coenzyme A ligase PaaK-like adenylate-forming protein